jgi:hypothetical protein
MGLTTLELEVANPAKPEKGERVTFLVDSGAIYSVGPAPVLKRLGIKPLTREEFRLAGGSTITRKKGVAVFRYGARAGGADVIFGEPGDSVLLGAFTLEALGLSLDPLRRELRPLPLVLAGMPEGMKRCPTDAARIVARPPLPHCPLTLTYKRPAGHSRLALPTRTKAVDLH